MTMTPHNYLKFTLSQYDKTRNSSHKLIYYLQNIFTEISDN